MTNEEMQRAMDFIIQQQAQFATDIQELRESQKELVKIQLRGEERMERMEGVILRLFDVVEKVVDAQGRTDQKLAETDERLSQKLAETDERLNTLITVVERYISERRNGKS
jgi:predicted  nucleic acid-binding Zn-ribbon protein